MRVLQALFISLAVHILVVLLIAKLPAPVRELAQAVEIQLQERASQNETPNPTHKLVRTAEIPEPMKTKESDDPLKFLSEKTQRVKEQTRAALNGLTQNRKGQGTPSTEKQTARSAINKRLESGLGAFAPQQQNHALMGRHAARDEGASTLSTTLDERVKVGSITSLNTDRYLFYSFYARVEDLVYFRWSSMIEQVEATVAARMGATGNNTRWVTQMEIWLKSNGEFHSAHLMKESGVPEFDRAAISAFRQAGFFPNPPREMVEEDGLIRLKYGLTVYFDPKVVARP